MDLETFHQKLLGITPERTPKNFKLTAVQKALYEGSKEGRRGYRLKPSGTRQDPERFLATLVLAFHMTTFPEQGKVIFVVTRATEKWAIDQIKGTARYIYKSRKRASEASINAIDGALRRIDIGSRALQIEKEPERWVSYGYTDKDIQPPWMRGRLLLK